MFRAETKTPGRRADETSKATQQADDDDSGSDTPTPSTAVVPA